MKFTTKCSRSILYILYYRAIDKCLGKKKNDGEETEEKFHQGFLYSLIWREEKKHVYMCIYMVHIRFARKRFLIHRGSSWKVFITSQLINLYVSL